VQFSVRKLPSEAAEELRPCEISTVKPFALMLAPVYVFLAKNQKYVSVKGPLDFFTDADLERLKSFKTFYFPEFVDTALLFRLAARRVKALMEWNPTKSLGGHQKDQIELPPAPYELSDAVLRILVGLWGVEGGVNPEAAQIEPFFVAVFANEICDLMPSFLLYDTREKSVKRFERAIVGSSWAVFMALHLGYCNKAFLTSFRQTVFEYVSERNPLPKEIAPELRELAQSSRKLVSSGESDASLFRGITFWDLTCSPTRTAQRLQSRFKRISREMPSPYHEPPSIFGVGGFLDV
jgi:hypothetical protein